jgi:hypothetical protein
LFFSFKLNASAGHWPRKQLKWRRLANNNNAEASQKRNNAKGEEHEGSSIGFFESIGWPSGAEMDGQSFF